MSTPTWAQYEATHNTGSGALPQTSIPTYLRPGEPAVDAGTGEGGWFVWAISSLVAAWAWGNERAGLPLAFSLGALFGLGAASLWNPPDFVLWLIALWWAWLAVKFTAVGVALLIRRLWVATRARHRRETAAGYTASAYLE